ncbi:unnamed protein product [Caenorhabditis auriculariae]|uniref:Transposase Tc1-like domain-containing protein n=1 Tax=Caenorhabditis auriculariae TaxID=2777116 RepID=A0A8S1HZ59_9PELO|nr:unnamed protein product [Caenorhabditis auriculariae]
MTEATTTSMEITSTTTMTTTTTSGCPCNSDTLKIDPQGPDDYRPVIRISEDLTDNDKRTIVVGRQNGLTMMTLAGMFGVTEACISQSLKRRKAQDGSTKSQRTGRSQPIQDTAPTIRREVFSNSPSSPSVSTVKRGLNAAGIMGRRPVKKPLISEKNRAARVKWTKEHLNWTRQDWNKILWSDESKFLLFGSDGIQWDRFVGPQNLVPVLTGPVEMLLRPLHPGGSILFRNQRRRFTVETDGGDGEFKKNSRLIVGAVSLGLVLGVFKMFLSPLRSLKRGLPGLRNARLCHVEHSCQRHHGQSILTTHNDVLVYANNDPTNGLKINEGPLVSTISVMCNTDGVWFFVDQVGPFSDFHALSCIDKSIANC